MRSADPNSLERHFEQIVDTSDCTVFSDGTLGAAHIDAHAALDAHTYAQGYRQLGAWLDSHSNSGSKWIHLQFHMALFELELGLWTAAYARFRRYVLPAARNSADALTDAPGLLWRLELSAHKPITLPWQPLRATALSSMERQHDAWIQIHNLLAFAGAGDRWAIERSLERGAASASQQFDRVVENMALALHAHSRGAFGETAVRLNDLLPRLPAAGGSRAQLDLFRQLRDRCRQRASGAAVAESYARAA